jgi:1,4-alpha-glucan branching enzyme
MSFGLMYAFNENFVLPLSHDEVVHGKGSMLGKMPGDRWQKFANLRAYYGFMFGHPGKKLLFMGNEFAQEREWDHERSLDWHLNGDPLHAGMQALVRDLNHLLRDCDSLHQRDFTADGFEWVSHSDAAHSVLSFVRRSQGATTLMLVVCNFTPVVRRGWRIGVPRAGRWRERLNTDSHHYGGSNVGTALGLADSQPVPCDDKPDSILIDLPPLATVMFEWAP